MSHMIFALSAPVIVGDDGKLPTAFRLFKFGLNETSKGTFLFDQAAAADVMASWKARGVDLMIDLDHGSLAPDAIRDDQRDARGWFQLETKEDGLWAVNVSWTPDGAERLLSKKQRYFSPAFQAVSIEGQNTKRVASLLNCAICAMPATHDAPALVAASRVGLAPRKTPATVRLSMNPETLKAAIEVLKTGDAKKALDMLEALVVEAAGGGGAPAADPAATSANPDGATPEGADPAKPKDPVAATVAASLAPVMAALAVLASSVKTITDSRQVADDAERVALTGDLVRLGSETPATAWEGDASNKKPAEHIRAMSVPYLRDRVVKLTAGRKPTTLNTPPGGANEGTGGDAGSKEFTTPHGVVTLSSRELTVCTETKADPAAYAVNKAIRAAALSGGSK